MTTSISSGAMVGSEATAAEQSRMELQAKLNGLGGLNGRQLSPEAKEKKLREACQGFESIFIQKMWQEMRNAVPKTGLLTGREERFWQDMYDQELSKSMTAAGGIGLADMMYEQLSRNLVSASRSAAGSNVGSAFVPGAAPLVPQDAPDQLAPPAPASVYESEAPQMGAVALADMTEKTPVPANAAPETPAQPAAPKAAEPAPARVAEAAAIYGAAANSTHSTRGKIHAPDLSQSSGLINAQKARREAGDKLGSRAIRPSQSRQPKQAAARETAQANMEVTGAVTQEGQLQPGSAAALKSAVEMARSGAAATENFTSTPTDLKTLVANVQAKNAAAEQMAPQNGQITAQAEPVTRKVRRTTNIPQKGNNKPSSPTQSQAIRTLNVDNVGVNSKAGQGLRAYLAQKEAQQAYLNASAQTSTSTQEGPAETAGNIPPLTAQAQTAAADLTAAIPPLTAKTQMQESEAENFAIPPLTASRI